MGINQPPGYVHPRKRKGAVRAQLETTEPAATDERPIRKKDRAGAAKPNGKSASSNSETVLLRLAAHPPAKGEIALYDEMRESGLSDKDAILALLRHGTSKLSEVAKLSKGAFAALSYQPREGVIETNRKISSDLHHVLKERFDPFGALTTRALAIKIGEAILVLAIKEKSSG